MWIMTFRMPPDTQLLKTTLRTSFIKLKTGGRSKPHLSALDEDISSWLMNPESRAGKLKVLLKTHKPNTPAREVFSVCNQPVENLSSFLQFSYLGPIVNSGILKWRLRDTKELIQFLHGVNDKIKSDRTTDPISLSAL